MFFNRKNKHKFECSSCKSKIKDEFSYCPYCGRSLLSKQEQNDKFGLLGNHDGSDFNNTESLGFTDKIFSSLIQNVMKNLDKQLMKELESNANITNTPNGIKIQIGQPPKKKKQAPKLVKRTVTEDQMKKISKLPRKQAKTNIKRLGDKIIYELNTPGVVATDDVFVSKLESGYEVKALGDDNMYVNTLPINMPIKSVVLEKNKIVVEFSSQQE